MKIDENGVCGHEFWNKLPKRFRWTPHNLFAHPVSEVLYWFGLGDLGNKLHDLTIPRHITTTKTPTGSDPWGRASRPFL